MIRAQCRRSASKARGRMVKDSSIVLKIAAPKRDHKDDKDGKEGLTRTVSVLAVPVILWVLSSWRPELESTKMPLRPGSLGPLIKTAIFTVLVPGTVGVYIPYRLLARSDRTWDLGVFRYLGLI